MHEYVGSIHLHSLYSDGGGTVREITAAARRAGLDYVVLTDHDTLRPRDDGWPGWRDGVLLMIGVEITCRGRSHVLALGAQNVAGLRWKPLRRVLFDLENQGAAATHQIASTPAAWTSQLTATAAATGRLWSR